MESLLFLSAIQGLQNLLDFYIFLIILAGVAIGTILAVTPQGFGLPLAYALLLPIVVTWDPLPGIVLLIAINAVSSTCAAYLPVLFGIPGGAGSQSTVMDGYPMGRRGEARRALGAAFTAGGIGTLIGTLALALAVPVARPLVSAMGAPHLFVVILWGLTMIAVLAGRNPIKGLIAASFGLLLSTVGQQPETGIMRFLFGQFYLLDGLAISIVALAVFGVPAAMNLTLTRLGIERKPAPLSGSLVNGVKDAFREWWLVLRCSFLGVWVGIVPGLGVHTVDWLAYGHAAQTCKGARETFGKGDVRGVIAPESANDAKDGGDLITTLLLGIPQGAVTALFIVALLAWGLTPGPEMVSKHADVIFSIIWTLGIAGMIGVAVGFVLANQLAKLAQVRYTILVPLILSFVLLGSFNTNRDPLDLVVVLFFGILGYMMFRLGYPRPAMILGLVLGQLLERYLYRSVGAYGAGWLLWPSVMVLLSLTLASLAFVIWSRWKTETKDRSVSDKPGREWRFAIAFRSQSILSLFFLSGFALAISAGWNWPLVASVIPVYIGATGVVLVAIQLLRELMTWEEPAGEQNHAFEADEVFDVRLDRGTEIRRMLGFFGWLGGSAVGIWSLGMVIGMPLFLLLYGLVESRGGWYVPVMMSAAGVAITYGFFELFLGIRWPRGFLFQ